MSCQILLCLKKIRYMYINMLLKFRFFEVHSDTYPHDLPRRHIIEVIATVCSFCSRNTILLHHVECPFFFLFHVNVGNTCALKVSTLYMKFISNNKIELAIMSDIMSNMVNTAA